MSGLFSTISGTFGKDLVLGAFAPAVIALSLWLLLVAPLLPEGFLPLERLSALGAAGELIAISLVVIVLTVLLHNLSTPIIRLYEGYPWRSTGWGVFWSERFRRRWDLLHVKRDAIPRLKERAKAEGNEDALRDAWSRLGRVARTQYPHRRSIVLPTRLGNVIRAFECYPLVEYGMEAVDLWPRLVPVMEPSYASSLSDARTSVSFMLNLSLLSLLLSLALLVTGAAFPPPEPVLRVLLPAAVGVVAGYLFYRLAVGRAQAWGNLIAGAFDLYRWDLLKRLGYEQKPRTRKAERELWLNVSRQLRFGDQHTTRAPRLDYADAPSGRFSIEPRPEGLALESSRALRSGREGAHYCVVVTVKNVGSETLEGVVVRDALDEGVAYAADSVRLAPPEVGSVMVKGTGPYTFQVETALHPGHSLSLEYGALIGARLARAIEADTPPAP